MSDILILAALREEVAKIRRSDRVTVALTGDGAARAWRGAAAAIERTAPRLVIGIGIAGALSSDLCRGDLVVARTIVDENGAWNACDPAMVTVSMEAGGKPVTLVTTGAIATPLEKRNLAGSLEGSAAVDLESAAWQRAATERSLPFTTIRCILDTADEALPAFLARCTRADGSISRFRVVLHALLHPFEIPRLIDLRRRTSEAAAVLARGMESFLFKLEANG